MRPQRVRLTRLELQLMDILWDLRQAVVRDVLEKIPENKRPAYTTVQTILNRLEEKGAVRKVRKIGNAWLLEPVISRKKIHQRLIDDLVELFGGNATPVVSHLVETGKLTLEDLKALESQLQQQREDD